MATVPGEGGELGAFGSNRNTLSPNGLSQDCYGGCTDPKIEPGKAGELGGSLRKTTKNNQKQPKTQGPCPDLRGTCIKALTVRRLTKCGAPRPLPGPGKQTQDAKHVGKGLKRGIK